MTRFKSGDPEPQAREVASVPAPPLSGRARTAAQPNLTGQVRSPQLSRFPDTRSGRAVTPPGASFVGTSAPARPAVAPDPAYVGPVPLPVPDPQLFWTLPGPSAFLQRLGEQLDEDGQLTQVIVAVPIQTPPPDLSNRIAKLDCDRKVVSVKLAPGMDDSLFALLLCESGDALPDRLPGPGDLISGVLRHCRVVVDCLQATVPQLQDAMTLIGATGASAHSLGPTQAPLQVVLLVPGQRLSPAQDRRTRVSVCWWWGQLGRLDTALFVHHATRVGPTGPDALSQVAIVEVAGFDLSLAQFLVNEWDSSDSNLRAILEHYAAQLPGLADCDEPTRTGLQQRPGGADLSSWSLGGCDRWGDESRWHACSAYARDPDSTTRALWRAQASVLLPLIDERRVRAVGWLNGMGHGSALWAHAAERERFADLVEISDVCTYMRTQPQLRQLPQYKLIAWLYETRNLLAHLRCLTPESLKRGMALSLQIEF